MVKTALKIIIACVFICSMDVYSVEIEKVTLSLEYLYNYYYDPGALENKADSSSNKDIKDKRALKSGKGSDSLPLIVVDDRLEINDVALFFIDSIPYIRTLMVYHGDKTDLHALGVNTGAYHGGVITVRFPLANLPQIASLPTVEKIIDNALTEDLGEESLLIKIHPKIEDTTGE